MKFRRGIAELAVVLLFVGAPWGAAAEEALSVKISGRVTNGTQSDRPVLESDITLFSFSTEKVESTHKTRTDEAGFFVFNDLLLVPETSYIVSTEFQGVKYFSTAIQLDPPGSAGELAIRVFEKSTDPSRLKISRRHLIIERFENRLSVQEMIFLKNDARYTWVPDGSPGLRFQLPPGAVDLSMGERLGEGVRKETNAVVISFPVRPEGQEITFRYYITGKADTYQLQYELGYPTEQFDVFMSIPGANLTSESLERNEAMEMGGVEYSRFTGQNLAASTPVMLSIEVPALGVDNSIQIVLFLAAIIAAGAALIFPFVKRVQDSEIDPRTMMEAEHDRLVDEIAQLDFDFKKGNAENGNYQTMRKEKKQRAVAISRRLG